MIFKKFIYVLVFYMRNGECNWLVNLEKGTLLKYFQYREDNIAYSKQLRPRRNSVQAAIICDVIMTFS